MDLRRDNRSENFPLRWCSMFHLIGCPSVPIFDNEKTSTFHSYIFQTRWFGFNWGVPWFGRNKLGIPRKTKLMGPMEINENIIYICTYIDIKAKRYIVPMDLNYRNYQLHGTIKHNQSGWHLKNLNKHRISWNKVMACGEDVSLTRPNPKIPWKFAAWAPVAWATSPCSRSWDAPDVWHPPPPKKTTSKGSYTIYCTSFGNLASKTASHFCKLFFVTGFGEILVGSVSVRGAFGVKERVDSRSATFSSSGAGELGLEKQWNKIGNFVVRCQECPLLYSQWAFSPDVKRQEVIYHPSICSCVPSLDLLDSKEDNNWWWSRSLKNAMSLHCPKQIPSCSLA